MKKPLLKKHFSTDRLAEVLNSKTPRLKAVRTMSKPIAGRLSMPPETPGAIIGEWHRDGKGVNMVYSAGTVNIGMDTAVLGVVDGSRAFFVGRHGRIAMWPYTETTRRQPSTSPVGLEGEALSRWANEQVDMFLECVLSTSNNHALSVLAGSYRRVVGAHVEEAISELKETHPSLKASHTFFARAVSSSWTYHDLTSNTPTTRHALLVSLALSLSAEAAGKLISHAALLEYRLPLIDERAAASMYTRAAGVLAKGAPTWWLLGKATDWEAIGLSISSVLGDAFWMVANDAAMRERDITAGLGLAPRRSE